MADAAHAKKKVKKGSGKPANGGKENLNPWDGPKAKKKKKSIAVAACHKPHPHDSNSSKLHQHPKGIH